jgi:hypothetical protein
MGCLLYLINICQWKPVILYIDELLGVFTNLGYVWLTDVLHSNFFPAIQCHAQLIASNYSEFQSSSSERINLNITQLEGRLVDIHNPGWLTVTRDHLCGVVYTARWKTQMLLFLSPPVPRVESWFVFLAINKMIQVAPNTIWWQG